MAFTVTAQPSDGNVYGTVLQVIVLTGASAVQPGAEDAEMEFSPVAVTVTPQATGSLVYGVDSYNPVNPFTGPYDDGTTFLDGSPFTVGDPVLNVGAGVFFRSTDTTTEGTPVTIGADAIAGVLAVAEILPDGTLAVDASSPALVSSLNDDPATTDAFDPPGGSLLVGLVADAESNGTPAVSISDSSGLGLEWVDLASLGPPVTGRTAGIWAAYIPGGDDGGGDDGGDSLAAEQTLTLTANTETHLASTTIRYSQIVVENNGTDPVFVCCDGGTATVGGDGCLAVPPGEELGFGNLLQLGNANVPGGPVPDGWTAQQYVEPDAGYMTYVSLICAADASVAVTVY